MTSDSWRKKNETSLALAIQSRLQPTGLVPARRLPGIRELAFARWIGSTWQELSVDCVSWRISTALRVAYLPVALLRLRMMERVGKPLGPGYPHLSFSAWLKKVHDGPLRGTPFNGGAPFYWRFNEEMNVETTTDDICAVFQAVASDVFEQTLTPESTRTFVPVHRVSRDSRGVGDRNCSMIT